MTTAATKASAIFPRNERHIRACRRNSARRSVRRDPEDASRSSRWSAIAVVGSVSDTSYRKHQGRMGRVIFYLGSETLDVHIDKPAVA